MPVNAIIVDDEPLAIQALELLLKRFDEIRIIATCPDAFAAFEVMQKETVDLMFLDINMPEMTGVGFLRSLKNPPKVIFTTAHRDFALEAFELDAVDYLLKPVSYERLMKAIGKYHQTSESTVATVPVREHATSANHMFVRAERKMVKINFDDILYIEGLKDYVKIITESKTIITKMGMGQIRGELPAEGFVRCHRSYIVNRTKVTAYTKYDIEIRNTEIPIGASYLDEVTKALA